MAIYLITYDLKKPGQQYEALHEKIKNLGSSWWHYLESTWLVDTTLDAAGIWKRLEPVFDKNDRALIVSYGEDHQGWLPQEAWDWINQRRAAARRY